MRQTKRSFNSIRARVTAAFSLATAGLMLLAVSGMTWYARYDIQRDSDALLATAAHKIARELTAPNGEDAARELTEAENDLSNIAISTLVVDPQGHVLHRSPGSIPPWPHTPEDSWRIKTLALNGNTIVVGMHWRATERNLRNQMIFLTALCLIILFGVTTGAWIIVGQSLLPIRHLAQQAQRVTAENLRVQLVPSSQDAEILELVTTLNGLLSRLFESAAAKGRFYAAASHELRTPLQALSGHLELARTRPRTPEEYQAIVQEAHTQTRRLTTLVRDLLLLNQLDTAPLPTPEPLDPGEVGAHVLSQFTSLLTERGLCLEAHLDTTGEILAPPNHLEMLTRNLIENAVKYARQNGTLRVEFAPDGKTLTIFNECDPLLVWDEQKLFEPFSRLDASRNSKTGGNGLGLAICRAIANANGWQISLQQVSGGVLAHISF